MKSIHKILLVNTAVAALAVGTGACGGDSSKNANAPSNPSEVEQPANSPEPQAPSNNPTSQEPLNQPTPQQSALGNPTPEQPGLGQPSPQQPGISATGSSSSVNDDGQIAAVTNAASTSEVQQGQLAQSKATRPDVKQFAMMMVTDHRGAMQKQTVLLQRLQIVPQSNPVAMDISTESQQNLESLRDAKGKDFDKEYIDDQVKGHAKVLDLLDNQLIPNAKNPDLKANLQQMRPTVAEHLKKAQAIQDKIEQGKSGNAPKDSGHSH